MPTRIELLKQAGFSDGEIGDWATTERRRMQEAGFADSEIDDEFGVTRPPKEAPPAFIERLKQGNWLHRTLGAAGEYARHYFGDEPLGFSPENREALSKLGVVGDIIVPVAKPVDALLRSVPAGIAGLGAGLGQMVEEGHDAALGPGPYAKARLPAILRNSLRFSRVRTGRRPGRYAGRPPMSRTSPCCRERRIFVTPPRLFPELQQVSPLSRNSSDYGPTLAFRRPRSRRMHCSSIPS